MGYNFNPFNKRLDSIEGKDLIILKEISEGWYIDYKEDIIELKKLAKHLSSFANQFGGYLFFGIKEDDTDNRYAEEFCGIDKKNIGQYLLKIREAATSHCKPEVYYEEKIIKGPVEEIDLPENKSIIIVGIPEGDNPPYIHSSGRIYKRLGDSSVPKEISDRYDLDLLYEKNERTNNKIRDRINNMPELSDSEGSIPFISIHIIPSPSNQIIKEKISFNKFKDITFELDDSVKGFNVIQAIDNVYPTSNGFIGRIKQPNNISQTTISLRWWHDGMSRIIIPLNYYNLSSKDKALEDYQYFEEILPTMGYEYLESSKKIVDLTMSIPVLAALLKKILKIREILSDKRDLRSYVELRNFWRKIPFIDSKKYIQSIKETGFPIIENDFITIPELFDLNNLIKMKNENIINTEDAKNFDKDTLKAIEISSPLSFIILQSLGLVSSPEDVNDDDKRPVGWDVILRRSMKK